MAIPYVQFGLMLVVNIYMFVCCFYFWCVLRSVCEISPHLDTSHDEILIRFWNRLQLETRTFKELD